MDDREKETFTKENDEIFKSLVSEPILNKLPERLFKYNFLPFFCGEIDIATEPNFFAMWYGIAGSPYAEVQIIDDVTGQSLFIVPGIMDSSIINSNRENAKISLHDVVIMAKLHSNQTPIAGANVLNGGFAKKYNEIQEKSKVFTEYEKRWTEIFKRYGKLKEEQKTPEAVKKYNGDLSDDDFEF